MPSNPSSRWWLLVLVVFAGSFAATVATRSQTTEPEPARPSAVDAPLARWLKLAPDQAEAVAELDPGFAEERWVLQQEVDEQRTRLAQMLDPASAGDDDTTPEDESAGDKPADAVDDATPTSDAAANEAPPATDQDILDQVERVIAAQDTLERRVAQHIVAVRGHLTPDQQKRLLGLCAKQVRKHRHQGWGRGYGRGMHRGGAGHEHGGGKGRGHGPGHRGGRGQGQGRGMGQGHQGGQGASQ